MDLHTIDGGDGLPPEPEWSQHYSDELDIEVARDEWGVVVREMQGAETLSVANGHAIRRLVEFRIQWRRASEHVADHGAIIRGKTTGRGGQWNPHWSVMRQADDKIRALEAELGLSPRRRAAAVKAKRRPDRGTAADDYLGPTKR
jgi:P27 family predicted phage terminase small subunit